MSSYPYVCCKANPPHGDKEYVTELSRICLSHPLSEPDILSVIAFVKCRVRIGHFMTVEKLPASDESEDEPLIQVR